MKPERCTRSACVYGPHGVEKRKRGKIRNYGPILVSTYGVWSGKPVMECPAHGVERYL